MIDEVEPGQKVLIDDGNIELRCTGKTRDRLICKVIQGGLVTSKKGINLPETQLSVPALTEWDIKCIEFAVKKHVDYLALSFVRNAADIRLLKDHLKALGARPVEPSQFRDTEIRIICRQICFSFLSSVRSKSRRLSMILKALFPKATGS